MNNTINRAEGVIQKRIECLDNKIANVKERWPEALYGLRWMEKVGKYEKEIEELHEYLEDKAMIRSMLDRDKECMKDLFSAKKILREVVSTLKEYGEFTKAERLERELNYFDEL